MKRFKKKMVKKLINLVEKIDKKELMYEMVYLGIAIMLYLIGKYLDMYECIVIYILVRMWIKKEVKYSD